MSNTCTVYLYKASGLKDGEVAVDFADQSDVDKFTEVFHPGKRNLQGNTWLKLRYAESCVDAAGIASFVNDRDRKNNQDTFTEGYYSLNLSALKAAGAKSRRVFSSLRFAYSMKVPKGVNALIPETTTRIPVFVSPNWSSPEIPIQDDYDRLVVHNVGNSNFQELLIKEDVGVVYDHGCTCIGKLAPKIIAKMARKRYSSQNHKPLLVISHWDMDHVNMLNTYSRVELMNSFSAVVFPNLFFSEFSKRIYNKFVLSGIERYPVIVYSYKQTPRVKLVGSKTTIADKFVLYGGVSARDKCTPNFCCIGIIVTGVNNCKAVLIGDQLYSEVISVVNSCDFLVVPHHGSEESLDGTKDANMIPSVKGAALFSASGRYGHPRPQIVKLFKGKGINCMFTKGLVKPISEPI